MMVQCWDNMSCGDAHSSAEIAILLSPPEGHLVTVIDTTAGRQSFTSLDYNAESAGFILRLVTVCLQI